MVFCGIKNQKLLFKVCSFLNFRMWFKYGLKQHALKGRVGAKLGESSVCYWV